MKQLLLGFLLILISTGTLAEPLEVELRKSRLLGVDYHQLDDHTRLLGWRLNKDWYFGRSRAESSEVALIWKTNTHNQVSLSKDGLRFQRRF